MARLPNCRAAGLRSNPERAPSASAIKVHGWSLAERPWPKHASRVPSCGKAGQPAPGLARLLSGGVCFEPVRPGRANTYAGSGTGKPWE